LAKTVPGWLAGDVKLFAHGGLETLAAIRKINFDVLSRRPTVSKLRQSWLLVRAMTRIL
jgi:phytoene/squalene synthetase